MIHQFGNMNEKMQETISTKTPTINFIYLTSTMNYNLLLFFYILNIELNQRGYYNFQPIFFSIFSKCKSDGTELNVEVIILRLCIFFHFCGCCSKQVNLHEEEKRKIKQYTELFVLFNT